MVESANPTRAVRRAAREPYRSPYELWKDAEGLPTIRGLGVNVHEVELTPWASRGGSGVFMNLDGTGGFNDAYVCEIPPGKSLSPVKHIYEETIYILSGRGATSVWIQEDKKQTFEWGPNSYFSIPPNASFQMHNGAGSGPARYFAMTAAPRIIDAFKNLDFVFNNPYVFSDRFDGEPGYFQQSDGMVDGHTWRTNFIADIMAACRVASSSADQYQPGLRGINVTTSFKMVNSTMNSHSSSWPIGTYKGAHRHGPGIHVMILRGEGYSLMWEEGEPVQRVDWGPGSVFVPPEMWLHEHFNTGPDPVLFLAIGWGSDKSKVGGREYDYSRSIRDGGDAIPYAEEDPQIHRDYHEALARSGASCQMGAYHPYCASD